jgi:hypothetical protein
MNLLVFGTLLYPDILSQLIGKVPEMREVSLSNYERCKINIPGRPAKGPAAKCSPGKELHGKVLCNLSDKDMAIFDLFELAASGYRRITETVYTPTGEAIVTEMYVATDEIANYLYGEWSAEEFEEKYLSMYVNERIPNLVENWRKNGQYPQ